MFDIKKISLALVFGNNFLIFYYLFKQRNYVCRFFTKKLLTKKKHLPRIAYALTLAIDDNGTAACLRKETCLIVIASGSELLANIKLIKKRSPIVIKKNLLLK